jgi:HEPN domain-containing protein
MSDLDHARQMLAIARRDLKALGGMLDPNIFAYEIFGFHAQQTAEKALKSWIAALGGSYGFTHDLGLLLDTLNLKTAVIYRKDAKVAKKFKYL